MSKPNDSASLIIVSTVAFFVATDSGPSSVGKRGVGEHGDRDVAHSSCSFTV